MYFYSVLAFCLFSACCIHSSFQSDELGIKDYYWRDYKGIIPTDALPAGLNSKDEATYVAQVLHNNSLIPGEINNLHKRAYYEWELKEFEATENVKILCTKQPQLFQWINTTKVDFKMLTDKNLISGGYQPNNPVYIGRKDIDDKIVVGKVQVDNSDLSAIFYYIYDQEVFFSYTFEVLSYL